MQASFSTKQASLAAAALLFAAASACAAAASTYHLALLLNVGLTALAASGLILMLGSGQVSLGQAAFMGIGAYTAAILVRDHAFSPAVALAVAVAVSSASALVLGWVAGGLKGHFLPLATLAVGISVPTAIVGASSVTGGASGFGQIPPFALGPLDFANERWLAVLVWGLVAAVAGGLARLQNSRMGRAIAAVNASDEMAQMSGIDTARVKLLIFMIAGGLAGLAGALYAFYFKFVSPSPFGLTASFNLLLVCILGGAASPFGAVLGAVAVAALEMFLQDFVARTLGLPGHVEMMVFGAILVAALLRWPGGIWSALARFWPRFSVTTPRGRDAWKADASASSAGELLKLSDIGKSFDGLQALTGINFSVRAGEIVGLIGPNGAGKSTTFNIATGLTAPSGGSVHLDGNVLPSRLSELAGLGVARTFQHVKLAPGLTVIENVALGAYRQGKSGFIAGALGLDAKEEARTFEDAWRVLRLVELDGLADTPCNLLTMGQARLVEVARAIASRPRLILLDEPAAGLRTGEKMKLVGLLHTLRRAGVAVLIVEHDMDLVMNCVDRLIVLDRGKSLAEGRPEQIQANPRVIAAYLGT